MTEEQIALMNKLTDEFVDNQEMISKENLDSVMDEITSATGDYVYEKWNVWMGPGGVTAPVASGSALGPPSCANDGNTPCASCDCN